LHHAVLVQLQNCVPFSPININMGGALSSCRRRSCGNLKAESVDSQASEWVPSCQGWPLNVNVVRTHQQKENKSGSQVQLPVTPKLLVPTNRLPTRRLASVVEELASIESQKGLIDNGGVFDFPANANVLANVHPHGFIAAATAAFANHYPLAVRPQHFWMMILQATAVHVGKHSEEIRANWVPHEGKKELEVRCDDFRLGARNNWASVVDGRPDCFSAQIDRNVVEGLALELSPPFSDTLTEENIALKITVMDITKSFFSFKCTTMCGFPYVFMEGTLEDWVLLRKNAELLIKKRCAQKFAVKWCASLLPLLDILVKEYQKGDTKETPDERFWNSMCKRGGTSGSGARTWFNGWINILFPYIKDTENCYMVPYSCNNGYVKEGRDGGRVESHLQFKKRDGGRYGMGATQDAQGPDCADFPGGLAAAPVLWDYNGSEMKLTFKAGFVAAEQNSVTGVIRPTIGWFIAHDGGEEGGKAKGKWHFPF